MPSPYAQYSDAEIVRLCIQQDGLAWRELFRRYFDLMYSIPVRYRCFDRDECWDIVETVLLALTKDVEALRNPHKLKSWLITTTGRESWRRALAQRRRRDREADLTVEPIDPAETPEQTIEWLQTQGILRKLVDGLPQPCRSLVHALFYEDRTYGEAANLLGYSAQTIGPTRGRCLKRLMDMLAEYGITSL